jgi:hypothetical protein
MGEHHEGISHDQLNRFMRGAKLRPRHLWQAVKEEIVVSENGYLLFDDTTINKEYSEKIEIAQRQYSGAKHGMVMGINVVTCVYYNPNNGQHWLIDYRIYNPIADGKSKLEHVEDMLRHSIEWKKLAFRSVLFDSWYATSHLMQVVHDLGKIFYCPIKQNRKVRSVNGLCQYNPTTLDWHEGNLAIGEKIRLKGVSKRVPITLHRMAMNSRADTEKYQYIATNDVIATTETVINSVGFRWKVEELHREVKQVTALEKCQCRKARAQRNHIACSFLAWLNIKSAAYALKTTIYQLKQSLIDDYIAEKLNKPLKFVTESYLAA